MRMASRYSASAQRKNERTPGAAANGGSVSGRQRSAARARLLRGSAVTATVSAPRRRHCSVASSVRATSPEELTASTSGSWG